MLRKERGATSPGMWHRIPCFNVGVSNPRRRRSVVLPLVTSNLPAAGGNPNQSFLLTQHSKITIMLISFGCGFLLLFLPSKRLSHCSPPRDALCVVLFWLLYVLLCTFLFFSPLPSRASATLIHSLCTIKLAALLYSLYAPEGITFVNR
jgi:hypothetical protein